MIRKYSIEEYSAVLDEIVRSYRRGVTHPHARERLTLEEALARLRKLGFTAGDALRLLRPERRK